MVPSLHRNDHPTSSTRCSTTASPATLAANRADQGKEFASFVDAELKAECDRRASVNTRAGAALTGSTGFVTIVLAVFAVFVGKEFTLCGSARVFLAIALLCLLLAAVCAVVAGFPWKSQVPSPYYLQSLLDNHWTITEVDARNITAANKVGRIRTLRLGTETKFRFLFGANIFQASAAAALVVCTLLVV